MSETIVVLGATSGIAKEYLRLRAREKSKLILLARNLDLLQTLKLDLKARGAETVEIIHHELANLDEIPKLWQQIMQLAPVIDEVLLAYGMLPEQKQTEQNFENLMTCFQINSLSAMAWLHHAASYFEQRKCGRIGVISSVAGDVGRRSNYVYGAAKASLSVFVQGLRSRMFPFGVHVMTIKPGFVDTPMTAHLPKNFLFASPQAVAQGIVFGFRKNKDIIYLPRFWTVIMLVVKLIPEKIKKRLAF